MRENAQEYDPGQPNDYEEVRRSREAARKAAEAEAERQHRIKLEAQRQQDVCPSPLKNRRPQCTGRSPVLHG